ncbi:hypothetical protein NECAME_02267, partial [Necator americanus]
FLFRCERCRFAKFPTEFALISHCKSDHGLKEFFVRYRFTPEGERKTMELKLKVLAHSLALLSNCGSCSTHVKG